MIASKYLAGLNEQQEQAVVTTNGPVMIVAGPGSGKTRVITHRIAYLVDELDVAPQNIMAVTFTNKAANEMKERLNHLIPGDASQLNVGTFHRICGRLLRRYGSAIEIRPDFTIYDTDDQDVVVRQAMEMAGENPKHYKPKQVRGIISGAKNRMELPGDFNSIVENDGDNPDYMINKVAAKVYPIYQQRLATSNALDFDDMIMRMVILMESHASVRDAVHRRIHYLMVDEFQDTNVAQYRLTKLLTNPDCNLCVVGDPDQSIYGWRYADIRNILNFRKDFPNAMVVNLGQNYRSSGVIVDAAGSLIKNNAKRLDNQLSTDNPEGDPITAKWCMDAEDEASWSLERLEELVKKDGYKWSDCAVLYRTNAQSRAFETHCVAQNIPHQLIGTTGFFSRAEVKDVLAYMNVIHNSDDVNLHRIINVPPRGIGGKTVEILAECAIQNDTSMMQAARVSTQRFMHQIPQLDGLSTRAIKALTKFVGLMDYMLEYYYDGTVVELMDHILEDTGLEKHIKNRENGADRWDNVLELRSVAEQYGKCNSDNGLIAFLEHVSLSSNVDSYDSGNGLLTLMTLHQAKGMEFSVVALAGLEDGTLPHFMTDDIEEERRLCYVGMTRAKERLFLSGAEMRRGQFRGQSMFWDEIPGVEIGGI